MNLTTMFASVRRSARRSFPVKATIALSLGVLVLPGASLARPSRLATFIAEREMCDHFRGEAPYDKDRARFIAAKLKRYCTGTDRRLKALRARYAQRPKLLAKLADYEDSIESN